MVDGGALLQAQGIAEHARLERLANTVEVIVGELYLAVDAGDDYPAERVAEALAEIMDAFGEALDEVVSAEQSRQDTPPLDVQPE